MDKTPSVIAATGGRFEPYHFSSAAANTQNPVIRAMLFQAYLDLQKLQALEAQLAAKDERG